MQFNSDEAVARYVADEMVRGLPPGWTWQRASTGELRWSMTLEGSCREDYELHVTSDRKLFIFEYGNTDAGGFTLEKVLLNAKVLDSAALEQFPLADAISHVIRNCKPNQWGLT